MDLKEKLNEYLNKSLLEEESYLEEQLERSSIFKRNFSMHAKESACGSSITNYIENNRKEDTFQTMLFKLIDERNLKDSDVYNKVNMDRRLFSKIRSNKDYHPTKETIILLGIALELTEEELEDLLKTASYSLPMNTTFDLIIRFCFKERIFNLNTINEFLFDHNCKLLNE